jgi:hypothetical protein
MEVDIAKKKKKPGGGGGAKKKLKFIDTQNLNFFAFYTTLYLKS